MDRLILEQYCSMQEEAKDLRKRIEQGERYLDKLTETGYIEADVVKGSRSDNTIGHIMVHGKPLPEIERMRSLQKRRTSKLKLMEEELMEKMNEVDDFINSIPQSDLRMIFRYYYLDNMTWAKVAIQMNNIFQNRNKAYTEDGCRMAHNRYIEKNL